MDVTSIPGAVNLSARFSDTTRNIGIRTWANPTTFTIATTPGAANPGPDGVSWTGAGQPFRSASGVNADPFTDFPLLGV